MSNAQFAGNAQIMSNSREISHVQIAINSKRIIQLKKIDTLEERKM